jgi:2-oxoisovalerate dehydrogenase E1 component
MLVEGGDMHQLSKDDLVSIYELMLSIRESETRTVELFKAGELQHGHVLPCLGQEAIPAGFSRVLQPADYVITGHRGAGHYIARGGDLGGLWAELYGKRTGIMKGRGGHMHLVDMKANTIAGNAIVGAQWVLGTGAGLAAKLEGTGRIVAVFGGEGSTNRGTFHEGLNFAAVKKLPILFVCENNAWTLFNPASEVLPIDNISDRAAAYGIPGVTVDGNDPLAVHEAAAELAERAREGKGPGLLECKTFKWSDSGSNLRMLPEQVQEWKANRDPVKLFRAKLSELGVIDAARDEAIRRRVAERLDAAVAFARSSEAPSPEEGQDEVYSVVGAPTEHRGHGIDQLPGRSMQYVEALRNTLREEMVRDERVFVMGEGVGGLQDGLFNVTQGLQKEFGEWRVMDTPLSEAAIAGAGVGAAMFGRRPVAEIMFSNLLALCGDEIHNQAGKFFYASGGQVQVPVVIRTSSWMRMVSGPHHCGALDAWMLHTPGIKVVAPSCPADAYGLLKASIREEDPVVFIEHSSLYFQEGHVPEGEYLIPIGQAEVKREGADVSVITYGVLVNDALQAAAELIVEGLDVEVLDLRTLRPMDEEAILRSVEKTNRVVVAYEGYKTGGIGAEVSALIAERAIDFLDGPIVRVAAPDVPHPHNAVLLEAITVGKDDIIAGVRKAVGRA